MMVSERPSPLPPLLLLTDDTRGSDPLRAAANLPSGCGVVLRSYGLPPAQRFALAFRLKTICRARRVVLLVSGDFRLAARVGAAGLHLPEGLARHGILAPALLWRRHTGRLLTMATHTPNAIRRGWKLKVDAVLLSPVFPTLSHPGAKTIGPVRFAAWCRTTPIPTYALGGITPLTTRRLHKSNATGVATVSGIKPRGYGGG